MNKEFFFKYMWPIMPIIVWNDSMLKIPVHTQKKILIPGNSTASEARTILNIINPYWDVVDRIVHSILEKNVVPADILQQMGKEATANFMREIEGITVDAESSYYWISLNCFLFMDLRMHFTHMYGYAIPCPCTMDAIASICGDKVVEMGAGKGYWASILDQFGIDVIAYDTYTDHKITYHPVINGDPSVLEKHDDRTLLLVWPPYNEPMAMDCLNHYKGDMVIYAGEFEVSTGDEAFHDALNNEWERIATIPNATWNRVKDAVYVYKRKSVIK